MRLKTSEIFGRDLEQKSAVLSSDWRRRRKIISAVDKFRWLSPLAVGGATSWDPRKGAVPNYIIPHRPQVKC